MPKLSIALLYAVISLIIAITGYQISYYSEAVTAILFLIAFFTINEASAHLLPFHERWHSKSSLLW